MAFRFVSFISLLLLSGHLVSVCFSATTCRCLPSQSCWPGLRDWSTFNSSVDGRLIRVSPPAAPCHSAHFDGPACTEVKTRWNNPFWRADQPGAMQHSNWETAVMSPSPTSTCAQGALPIYTVNVSLPWHVQATVRFASSRNLRLIMKNTGHDNLGRSTAPGSLSIWLHNMKNMSFHEEFVPDGCSSASAGPPAVTVEAGVQWEELYAETFQRKYVIVGGGCSSVGAAGGYPQGAGHSVLSPSFGLAADNILQYQVVTADGNLVTANRCQNQELFWALRGGGGGTYGVVVSATHKVRPALESLVLNSYNFTSADEASFRGLVLRFVQLTPSFSEAGWAGYFILARSSLRLAYLLPNRNVSFAAETFAPLLSYVNERQESFQVSGGTETYSSFQEWHLKFQCEGQGSCFNVSGSLNSTISPIGQPVVIASRLIPRTTVENRSSELAEKLVSLTRTHRVT